MKGDYANGRIYKIEPICEHDENEVYYGSTCQLLCKRMDSHRSNYKSWKNGNRAKTFSYELFEKYGIENCKIYLVELYPCETKEELLAREGYYIKNNKCVNRMVAGRTQKQYYEEHRVTINERQKKYAFDNKDKIKEYNDEYRQNNKEFIAERSKVYYEDHRVAINERQKKYALENKDKIKEYKDEYRQNNKEFIAERSKVYRDNNKDKLIEKHKLYYQNNKEKVKTRLYEKFYCSCCSAYFNKNNKSNHLKSKIHLENQTQNNNNEQVVDV